MAARGIAASGITASGIAGWRGAVAGAAVRAAGRKRPLDERRTLGRSLGVAWVFRAIDGGAVEAERNLRVLRHELQPPALGLGQVPDADEHHAERGDEVDVRAILVLRGDPRRKLRARRFPDEKVGGHVYTNSTNERFPT